MLKYLGFFFELQFNCYSVLRSFAVYSKLKLFAFAKNWTVGIIVENLFDTEWNETKFTTETILFNETDSRR